jgi:glycosyltransferase involved in cell wall biosynthesis
MISIVIPTYNEEKYLAKLLKSIKRQTYKDYEIIVADNSNDETKKIAERYNCIIANGGTPSIARNNGAGIAKYDMIFFDADVVLKDNNFISDFLRIIKDEKLDIASCKVLPDTKKMSHRLYYFMKNYTNRLNPIPHISGQCVYIKKAIFQSIKGYDENLVLGEEHDLLQRAKKQNVKYRMIMSLNVLNNTRRLKKEGFLKSFLKTFYSELYRTFIGKARKPLFNYEFGNHKAKI